MPYAINDAAERNQMTTDLPGLDRVTSQKLRSIKNAIVHYAVSLIILLIKFKLIYCDKYRNVYQKNQRNYETFRYN